MLRSLHSLGIGVQSSGPPTTYRAAYSCMMMMIMMVVAVGCTFRTIWDSASGRVFRERSGFPLNGLHSLRPYVLIYRKGWRPPPETFFPPGFSQTLPHDTPKIPQIIFRISGLLFLRLHPLYTLPPIQEV